MFVGDGAKPNRKFLKLLGQGEDMKNGRPSTDIVKSAIL